MIITIKILFHSYQPKFGRDEVFFFFSFAFFSIFVITPLGILSEMGPTKNQFLERSSYGDIFYLFISRCLKDKYFDIFRGTKSSITSK